MIAKPTQSDNDKWSGAEAQRKGVKNHPKSLTAPWILLRITTKTLDQSTHLYHRRSDTATRKKTPKKSTLRNDAKRNKISQKPANPKNNKSQKIHSTPKTAFSTLLLSLSSWHGSMSDGADLAEGDGLSRMFFGELVVCWLVWSVGWLRLVACLLACLVVFSPVCWRVNNYSYLTYWRLSSLAARWDFTR